MYRVGILYKQKKLYSMIVLAVCFTEDAWSDSDNFVVIADV